MADNDCVKNRLFTSGLNSLDRVLRPITAPAARMAWPTA